MENDNYLDSNFARQENQIRPAPVQADYSREDELRIDENSRWLNAHYNPLSTIYTFSSCMCLTDLSGDGDYRLIVADFGTGMYNMKLKVFRGTSLQSEHTLIDLPTGVVAFHMNTCDTKTPAIAVASGSNIFIYKNMRPFYKFTLPTLEVNPAEMDIWSQAKEEKIDVASLHEVLENIRAEIGESNLSPRSQRFLMLDGVEAEEFAELHKGHPLKRQTVITTLSCMKKTMAEEDSVSCLVLGTESRHLYILEPDAFTILSAVSMPSVPVFMDVNGLFDVEYRIVVSCRNGTLYTIKRGHKTAKAIVEMGSQPVALVKANNNIVVGCMDQTLNCYNTKGKLLWFLKLEKPILALGVAEISHLGLKLVIVSLSDGLVRFYQEKTLVDVVSAEDSVTALRFGRFGREDNALVMVTRGGSLAVKILKRRANFEGGVGSTGDGRSSASMTSLSTIGQQQKLNIPKKTKLFVDQTMREREHYIAMHRTFQQDLFRLRLNTARAYVRAVASSLTPFSFEAMGDVDENGKEKVKSSGRESLKMSAQVQGLGPKFLLKLLVQNTSRAEASTHLYLTFDTNPQIYELETNYITVPYLVPGMVYTYCTRVRCVNDLNISDIIKAFLVRNGENRPVLTAIISMPVSEGLIPT